MIRRTILLLVIAGCVRGLHSEESAFWVSFDQTKIEPNTRVDGEAVSEGCRLVGLAPVLFEKLDRVDGMKWQCAMPGTKRKPGKRGITNQMTRNKGLVLRVAGDGVIKLKTAIGEAAFATSDVSWRKPAALLGGKLLVMRSPDAARLSTAVSEDEYPGIACDGQGRVWVAWQSWDGQADSLLFAMREDGRFSEPKKLVPYGGDFYRVQLAPAAGGGAWVVWSEQREGNWDLYALRLPRRPGAKPLRLTTAAGSDFNQSMVATGDGETWIAWQAERGGQYDVYVAKLTATGLASLTQVTSSPSNDWEPALAADQAGKLFIVWDSYRNGSYDVFMKTLANGKLSQAIPVACTAAAEMRASVACDAQGRAWIAWENAGQNWGRHGANGKRGAAIHRFRRVEVCSMQGDQKLLPAVPVGRCRNAELRGLWELPKITVDAAGRPVLMFRQLSPIQRWNVRRKRKERQSRSIWAYFATRYDGQGWSRPALLPGSEGRQVQRLAVGQDAKGGIWLAYAGDARCRTFAEIPGNNNVFAARLPAAGTDAAAPRLARDTSQRQPVDVSQQVRRPRTATIAGETYQLVYGDTHRHTDISRCGMAHDGSLLDTYRYAIDPVQLDFLAISDHDQDILKHRYDRKARPLQNYMWWRSEKMCDVFQMTTGFMTLYGYEHGGSYKRRGGHKNIIYAERGNPCLEEDAPAHLFEALKGRTAIAIPHQLADGGSRTDWAKWNPKYERVAEVFQARGSYEFMGCPRLARVQSEGFFWWDALAKGCKIGAIASSDHGLVHSAYACVWVKDRSRRGVLEAMMARRTFGATDTIVMDFRIGESFMGEEITIDGPPTMKARVIGTSELKRVEVTRNGKFIYTIDPAGSEHAFTFTDQSLQPGDSGYYILRCVQENNELAWTSPIWVTRK